MNQAIRSIKTHNPSIIFSSPSSSGRQIGQRTSLVSFRKVNSVSSKPDNQDEMDKAQHQKEKHTGDVMSDSFGEGYATRSDEEGFGGIYGGNQTVRKDDSDQEIHKSHPEAYDKNQGSEVKEKEKARHQSDASS